jgi:hypothetical protein
MKQGLQLFALAVLAVVFTALTGRWAPHIEIVGADATFPAPIYARWIALFNRDHNKSRSTTAPLVRVAGFGRSRQAKSILAHLMPCLNPAKRKPCPPRGNQIRRGSPRPTHPCCTSKRFFGNHSYFYRLPGRSESGMGEKGRTR